MFRPILAAALVCLCAIAQAAPSLVITPSGYYLLDVGSDGAPVTTKIDNVIDYSNGNTPTPNPPGNTPDSATVKAVTELAKSIDNPVAIQALSMAYKSVGDKVKDGSISVEDAFPAAKAAAAELEKTLNLGTSLQKFRAGLGDYATPLLQNGSLSSRADVAQFLLDVSTGLDKAKPATAQALDPDLRQLIIQIITLILNRFLGGAGTGVTDPPVSVPGPF